MKQMLFVLMCASMLTYNLTGMQTSKSLLKDKATQNCIRIVLYKDGLPESEMCIATQVSVDPTETLQELGQKTECDEPALKQLFLSWKLPANQFIYLVKHLHDYDPECPLDAWDVLIPDDKTQSEYDETDRVSRESDDESDTNSILSLTETEEEYENNDIEAQEAQAPQKEKAYYHTLDSSASDQDDPLWQVLQGKKDHDYKRTRDVYKKARRIAHQKKADREPHHR